MSAGLFGSSIHLSDLEKALQTSLKTDSKFGSGCGMVDLSDGKGIASQVGLLTADWTPANEDLPKTFAVKISASSDKAPEGAEDNKLAQLAAEQQFDEKLQRIVTYHNRECLIFERFNEKNVSSVRLPKVFATKRRESVKDAGFIIMEHFSGCASLHMNNNLPYDSIYQLVSAVAAFHMQSSLFSSEEQEEMKGKMFADTFNIMFEPGMAAGLKKMIKDFGGDMMKEDAEEMATVIDEMSKPEYLKFIDNTAENLGLPRLLCHGDVWMCNLLWRKEDSLETEEFTLLALIDLQTAQFSCPAADLVRLFTGCMSGAQRQEQWEELTRLYWELMNDHFNGESPYSYEEMVEAYQRMFPPCAYVVAGSIGAVGQLIIDKQPNEEAKKEAHKNLLEKQRHLLADIIKYHKRNMALLKELRN